MKPLRGFQGTMTRVREAMESVPGEVTQLLKAMHAGAPGAAGRLLPLVYSELRRLAQAYMRWRAARILGISLSRDLRVPQVSLLRPGIERTPPRLGLLPRNAHAASDHSPLTHHRRGL
jgi:hypothetical protein